MEDATTLPIGGQGKYGEQPKSKRYQPKSGEDKYQCFKGEDGRERMSIRKRRVFDPCWDGEIHLRPDEP